MAEEDVTDTVTPETTTTPPVEAGFSLSEGQQPEVSEATTTADSRDYEAEARSMGWVPEAEWKGDRKPTKFLDAKEFVEKGETLIPMLRQQLEKERKDSEERFAKLERMNARTVERLKAQHARELDAMKVEREAAVKAGNVDEFRRIDKQIEEHQKSEPEAEPATKENPRDIESEWTKKNDWYGKDPAMTGFATYYSQTIARPDLPIEENLRLTEAEVRKQFPLHFTKTGANGHAPVDGGSPNGAQPARKDILSSKLPSEALRQAKADVASGLYKDTEAWAKVYFEK